jgi:hypothetical protein
LRLSTTVTAGPLASRWEERDRERRYNGSKAAGFLLTPAFSSHLEERESAA